MSSNAESVRKITERSEKARREFFKKVEKIARNSGTSSKLMQDIADQAASEYNKVFGRLGVHPLLHLKGGKKRPRYILERDECWILYKPPLWAMGGSNELWKNHVEQLVETHNSLEDAQGAMIKTEKTETLQEWHGLTQGLNYLDPDQPVLQWGFVQRLDVETDGPVLVAKTWRAQRMMQVQMKEHIFTKAYVCLVHGKLENRIQHIKARFAELGSDAATQVMLKHDAENDPFYEWSVSGKWKGRSVRMAETFLKPMAYYTRKEDNSEYTLVYVNILTGITHQIRITLQSLGHPLVSDDRYLPKDQAMSDLKWCPRNFLTETRSDWFDLCGPHKDPQRRKYTRISTENPLPKIFQNVLEVKLTLTEKLDPTADLYVGCQYWALGDEQLMNSFPKDGTFRRKVTRWGQRNGIHLDALNRLMLLSKEDINEILNKYRTPDDPKDDTWICPVCMGLNTPHTHRGPAQNSNPMACSGALGKDCPGQRIVEADGVDLPSGWMNWVSDPTIHFLAQVNPKWLEARRKILKYTRPSWEKPPEEPEGSIVTDDIILTLEAALVLNAKAGGQGIKEEDLPAVPGLADIVLPLSEPPEHCRFQRNRLPGSGTLSTWIYTLKSSERVKHVAEFEVKAKRQREPVAVLSDALPEKMRITKEEKEKRRKLLDAKLEKAEKEEEKKNKKEEEVKEKKQKEAAAKKKASPWKKLESTSNPGKYYYFNAETSESVLEEPADFEETQPSWEKIESKSVRGEYYYYNHETGESRVDRPPGVPVKEQKGLEKKEAKNDDNIAWTRMESKTKPGNYYYHNPKTGVSETVPPEVSMPWVLKESKSKKGMWYYFNSTSGENSVDPPPCARPSKKRGQENGDLNSAPQKVLKDDGLPPGWTKKESEKFAGKFYYVDSKTGATSWVKPKK